MVVEPRGLGLGASRVGALVLGLLVLWAGAGCTVGSKLRAKSTEIGELASRIEKRAYKCAPKELALAKSHAEFGLYELEAGNFVRADEHLAVSYENVQLADVNSRGPECLDVVVQADTDGDGILDHVDVCPREPEDFDNVDDLDGCPEDQDSDGDNIADSKDLCPTEPGPPENQGCPKVVQDKDGDGVADDFDRCPLDPEDKDGFEDGDGCPDLDNDKDGLIDANDQCPNDAEDPDGFEDDNGCPDFDNDNDKILDDADQCDNEPEDYDGDNDTDGCPDVYQNIIVKGDKIELKDKLYFATKKTQILPKSLPTLNEIADVLRKRPTAHVRIEGHTDDVGSDKFNKKLSDGRAQSVRTYLIGQGIAPERLEAIGYGEERPIEDNKTEDGRSANRRVEFFITKQ